MSDPQWQYNLDVASGRSKIPTELACSWAYWCISLLPNKARVIAAKAWKQGKYPSQVIHELNKALEESKE